MSSTIGVQRGELGPFTGRRIACINANGISMKIEEFLGIMVKNHIDYMFICETWVGPSSTRHPRLALNERYKGNDADMAGRPGRGHYGTAVLLHPKHDNDRSCLVKRPGGKEGFTLRTTFKGLDISGVYMRENWSPSECLEVLEPLATAGNSPAIIMGDWNTHFGGLQGAEGEMSRKDREILGWLTERRGQYEVLYPGEPAHTRFSHLQNPSVLDHIIGNAAAKRLFEGAYVLSRNDAGGSDHRVVVADFRNEEGARLTRAGRPMTTSPSIPCPGDREYPRIRLNRLSEAGMLEKFQDALAAKIAPVDAEMRLTLDRSLECPQDNLNRFEEQTTAAIREAAELILGTQTVRVVGGHVMSAELRKGKHNRRAAFEALWKARRDCGETHPTTAEAHREWRECSKIEKKLVKTERRRSFDQFAEHLSTLPGPALMKVMSRMKKSKIRRDSPTALATDAASMELYREYTQSVYRRVQTAEGGNTQDPTREEDPSDDDLPSQREIDGESEDLFERFSEPRVQAVIKSRPNGSAPGRTGITIELLKAGGPAMVRTLCALFRIAYKSGNCPKRWQEVTIIPIPKKGDLTKIENYRPIVMTEVMRKLFEKCVLLTDLSGVDNRLDTCQGGFRMGRSAPDQVASLHEAILLKKKQIKREPCMAFLDIKAAYDTVSRGALWGKVRGMGCNAHTVRILKALFEHNTSYLRVGTTSTSAIQHERGVVQGSILSPILYAIFMDDLPGRLRPLGTTVMNTERIASFFFADDIAIIADSADHLQKMLDVCSQHASELGYEYAPTKCKIVAPDGTQVQMNGQTLENLEHFTYLGIPVGMKGVNGKLFSKTTAAKTNQSIGLFRSIGMNAGGMGLQVKTTLIKTFIRPQLEYGIALVGKTNAAPLQRALNYAVRAALSVPPNTSTDAIMALTGIETVEAGRKRSTERFVDKAAMAEPNHLKHHAWKSHKISRQRGSIFNGSEKIERIRVHIPQWEEGVGLTPQGRETRTTAHQARWTNPVVLAAQPDPRPPNVNLKLRKKISKLPQADQALLCRWIARRPRGRPTPCTNCVLGDRATVEHMQKCMTISVDAETRAGRVKTAVPLIREIQRACLGGPQARYGSNLEYYLQSGPRTRPRNFGRFRRIG